jgi:large subunit ribosomal protein L28
LTSSAKFGYKRIPINFELKEQIMSRECELLGTKPQTGHYVPINRSQTGVRTNRRFEPNIQKITFASESLGVVRLRVTVKTLRSVEHNGGLDNFLVKTANTKLTTTGISLKNKVLKARAATAA